MAVIGSRLSAESDLSRSGDRPRTDSASDHAEPSAFWLSLEAFSPNAVTGSLELTTTHPKRIFSWLIEISVA
jgi:hypothetical protein